MWLMSRPSFSAIHPAWANAATGSAPERRVPKLTTSLCLAGASDPLRRRHVSSSLAVSSAIVGLGTRRSTTERSAGRRHERLERLAHCSQSSWRHTCTVPRRGRPTTWSTALDGSSGSASLRCPGWRGPGREVGGSRDRSLAGIDHTFVVLNATYRKARVTHRRSRASGEWRGPWAGFDGVWRALDDHNTCSIAWIV